MARKQRRPKRNPYGLGAPRQIFPATDQGIWHKCLAAAIIAVVCGFLFATQVQSAASERSTEGVLDGIALHHAGTENISAAQLIFTDQHSLLKSNARLAEYEVSLDSQSTCLLSPKTASKALALMRQQVLAI